MQIVNWILGWPYTPVVAFGLVSALLTLAGPTLVARYPRLGVVFAMLRRFGLDLSAPRTGRDAYELYRAAAGHVSASATPLPEYEELPSRQRDAWEASVAGLAALRPAPPSTPPSAPPALPPTAPSTGNGSPPSLPPLHRLALAFGVVLGIGIGLLLTGCTAAYQTAVDVSNAGAQVGSAAAPILTERCVEPMRAAAAAHDVDEGRAIAKRCDVPIAAYDELRVAHVALRAVTVALLSGQAPANVVQLISAVVAASTKLGDSISNLH